MIVLSVLFLIEVVLIVEFFWVSIILVVIVV